MISPPSGYLGLLFPTSSFPNTPIKFHRGFEYKSHSFRGLKRPISALGTLDTDSSSSGSDNSVGSSCSPSSVPIHAKSHPVIQFEPVQNNPRSFLVPNHRKTSSKKTPTAEIGKIRGKMRWDCKEMLRKYSRMLQDCVSKGSLKDGKALQANVIRSGLDPDSHLWTCLVNMYSKFGSFLHARHLLDEMPERDVVSWTALIAGFVSKGNGKEGLSSFNDMRKGGILPNGFTFATALKACSLCVALEFGKQLHGEVVKIGCLSDIYVGSALVDLYSKCSEMGLAESVFFFMPELNSVSWNALLHGYARVGNTKKVLELFNKMTESETRLSKFTLSSVLKGFASSGNTRLGRALHSLVIKVGTELDEFLSSSLVDMYSKCGLAEDAYKIFVRTENPDVVSWSGMISCLNQQGYNYEAVELFNKMRKRGVQPNQFTLSSLISAATDLYDLHYGKSIHGCIWKLGFEFDSTVSNALVTMYMKSGVVQDGCKVFDSMMEQDLISWNALLSGFHDGESDQGPRIFSQMLVEGFKPNKYTFISTLRSCSSLSDIRFGQQLHAHIIKDELNDDGFVGTALLDMYAKCGSLKYANTVFSRTKERDIFSWTVMITGHAQANQGEKAIEYFREMQREGVYPNESTLASCLKGCSGIASLKSGQQLHSQIMKAGYLNDSFIMSSLVDFYGKCGCIKDAETAFSSLVSRGVVLWNTIICGYSQYGYGEKALAAFQSMLDEGVAPDEVTFVGVLSACSHVGLIEEGKQHFDSLNQVYGITPTLKHCACMVDILGRAGKFDEIENFIKKMTLTPDVSIWQTVLGACCKHGNVEFGERAAKILFEIEPKMDSTYILLSNIYAAKGRWDDVAKVRQLMSSQGVKKEPGCSWVEIDSQVHIFLPRDGSHPKVVQIYQKLDELGQQLISVGYVPNTDGELHAVSIPEKKGNLSYHSERLALAFALISTRPRKPIRIFKNLRICGDCHNAIKLISSITEREIIIRDVSRFHHFQNGSCSCHDYW